MSDKYMDLVRRLEALTPGGSEFAGDPDACLRFVSDRLRTVGAVAKERNELRARLASLEAVAEAAKDVLSDIRDNWYIEKLQPGDVAESDVSVDHILALARTLEQL